MNLRLRSPHVGHSRERLRSAFSLLELLLVVAIIGIATAVVMPRFSVAMSGGQLNTATRTVARLGRYARTMALLHQTEVELILQLDRVEPEIRVEAAGWSRPESYDAQAGTPGWPAGRNGARPVAAPGDWTVDAGTPQVVAGDDRQGSSDEIRLVRKLPGVRIEFLGYTDRARGVAAESALDPEPESTVRIRFEANGICRPYRLRISDESGVWRELHVDFVGQAEIREPQT